MPFDISTATDADAAIATDLKAVASRLGDPFGRAEGAFLAIGERLCTAAGILGTLTILFERLPQRLEHQDVGEAAGHLAEVSRELTAMADALTEERRALDRLAALSDEVTGRIARLAKTVGTIAVLAINARIAAAHVDARGEDFSVFTAEIGRLARAAATTIAGFAAEHERLVGLLRSARANHAAFENAHRATLTAVAQRLEASLAAVAEHRRHAAGVAGRIGVQSKQIGQGIAEAVSALQIGDITRQRTEHVGHAVAILAGGLVPDAGGDGEGEGAGLWSATLPAEQRRTVVATVCRLQSAQLAQAVDDFDGEVQRVVSALAGLACDAREIVRLGAEAYGTRARTGGTFLEGLGADLREADALIKGCAAARSTVDRVAGAATESLGELLRQVEAVQRIEIDMRLVGLNTAFKCAHLGAQGRTLIVIAQELRGYANRTVEDSLAVMSGLRDVATAAEALNGPARRHGAERLAALESETAASVGTLESAGESLAQALAALASEGTRVAELLGETVSHITVHKEVGSVLRDAMDRLGRIAAATAGSAASPEAVKAEVMALVGGRYTMASERAIHEMFTDAPPAGPGPLACGEPLVAASIDDLLF